MVRNLLLLLICMTLQVFPQDNNCDDLNCNSNDSYDKIVVKHIYHSIPLYNDSATYNIVSFDYESNHSFNQTDDSSSIKLGIITSSNKLVDVIWEYQNINGVELTDNIQSVELNDLNQDGFTDIIVNYIDQHSDFSNTVVSSFLIFSNDKYHESPEVLTHNRYQVLNNKHIKNESPINLFGRPYLDSSQEDIMYWVDFYEFQNTKLININQKYRDHFEASKQASTQSIRQLIEQIKNYKMTEDNTLDQLQLEEYFNELIEHKLIIYRSNKVLF